MKPLYLFLFFYLPFVTACAQQSPSDTSTANIKAPTLKAKTTSLIDTSGKTIETRFLLPEGYQRSSEEAASFAEYLRLLPLKPAGSKVKYHNGSEKENYEVYEAVVDIKIGKRDLEQCADACMRLRAEYLFKEEKYDQIHFNLTNGFRMDYSEWMKGKRLRVNGNKTYWAQSASPSNTYRDFLKYMNMIFSYAGTLSLAKELKPVKLEAMQIGDIFIQGGSPGHAIMVVDLAIHETSGEKIFLLAQSYMPAQETQILKNRNDKKLNPWYRLSAIESELYTPEWTFGRDDLKRFSD